MKPNIMLVLVCCLAVVLPSICDAQEAAEDVDLRSLLPADTSFALIIDDAPSFIASWHDSPLAKLWEDPQVEQFLAPLRENMEIDQWNEKVREETGYELEELLGMFEGSVVVYGRDIGKQLLEDFEAEELDEDEVAPPFVFLARVGSSGEQLRELLLRKAEEFEQEEGAEANRTVVEEFRGVDLYYEREADGDEDDEEPKDVAGWSVVDGVFVATIKAELLETLVAEVLDGGAGETLAGTASFQSMARHAGSSDALLYVNLDQLVPVFEELFTLGYDVAAAADPAAGEEEQATAQPKIPAEKILNALSLDVLQAFFVSLDLESGGGAVNAGVTYSENRGLLKLLAYGPSAAATPSWIPSDAISFGSAAFDFQSAWAAVEEILNGIEPAFLMMGAAQANAVIQNAGVELDLRRDVLENLGNELVVVEVEPTATVPDEQEEPLIPVQSQLIALRIKQRQGIELALETLKNMMGQGSELFTGREYLDTTVYTVNDALVPAGNSISYAITDEYLLLGIGTPQALEAALIGMSRPRESAWKRADVKQALSVLPEGAVAVGFQDMAKTGAQLFDLLAMMSAMDADAELADPDAVPDDEVFGAYLGPAVSGFYKDNDSLVMRLRFMAPAGGAAGR